MSRTVVGLLAFAGGVAVGLLIAKEYAKSQAAGGVNSLLGALGIKNPETQAAIDSFAVPVIVG